MWCWPTFDAESRVSLRLVSLPQKIVGENIQVKRSVSDVIKDGETLTFLGITSQFFSNNFFHIICRLPFIKFRQNYITMSIKYKYLLSSLQNIWFFACKLGVQDQPTISNFHKMQILWRVFLVSSIWAAFINATCYGKGPWKW